MRIILKFLTDLFFLFSNHSYFRDSFNHPGHECDSERQYDYGNSKLSTQTNDAVPVQHRIYFIVHIGCNNNEL